MPWDIKKCFSKKGKKKDEEKEEVDETVEQVPETADDTAKRLLSKEENPDGLLCADDFVICSFAQLNSLTVRVWGTKNGSKFNPNVLNGGTGVTFTKSHNSKKQKKAKTVDSFKDGQFCFCLEFIDIWVAGVLYRVRCLNAFTRLSGLCNLHPKVIYKDGLNRILAMLASGGVVPYYEIKDPTPPLVAKTPEEEQAEAEVKAQKELEDVENEVEAKLANKESIAELLEKQADLMRVIGGGQSLLLNNAPAPPPEPAAPAPEQVAPPTMGTIYNSRRSASKKEAGKPELDKKQNWNPNQKRSLHVNKMVSIQENTVVRKARYDKTKKAAGLDME